MLYLTDFDFQFLSAFQVLLSSEAWFPPSRASISSTAGLDYERLTVTGPVIGATTLSYDMNQPSVCNSL